VTARSHVGRPDEGEAEAAPPGSLVLSIQDLCVDYKSRESVMRVLPGLSLEVRTGEIVGIVGESGSGKSTLALSLMRLLPTNGYVAGGRILLDGSTDIATLAPEELRHLRGDRIAMVFQDPLTSLNPTFRVGTQMLDVLAAHSEHRVRRSERREHLAIATDILRQVGLPDPEMVCRAYPHQLSGGMRQRVVIAMALSLDPEVLIADEPTSALDVTTESQIIDLLRDIRAQRNVTIVFVTHDLGVVAALCDRVVVMYAGQVVEQGPAVDVFARPQHPYTEALIKAVPARRQRGKSLMSIPGQVPSLLDGIPGCRFAPRCTKAQELCSRQDPRPVASGYSEVVRCHMRDPRSGFDWRASQTADSAASL